MYWTNSSCPAIASLTPNHIQIPVANATLTAPRERVAIATTGIDLTRLEGAITCLFDTFAPAAATRDSASVRLITN